MKNKAIGGFLKRLVSVLTSMAKAKTLALKSKTNALRTRLIVFSLLRDKKILMNSITQKLQNALTSSSGKHHQQVERNASSDNEEEGEEQDQEIRNNSNNAIVLYNRHNPSITLPSPSLQTELMLDQEDYNYEVELEEDKYPDLTHSFFELEELEKEGQGGSVIEMVKKTKKEGEEFRLEDEIDQVADLFIRKFHRQIRMQKQLSLKRHQEELIQRSA